MKRVLVSGYIGFNNFGDEAIFYALSKKMKELGVFVSALCANKNLVQEKYDVEAYYFKHPFEILKAIIKADILISGGGSLLQNKTSNFSLYYYLFILFLAKIFFKKTLIFAQGIEKINGNFQEKLTSFILKSVDLVTVRDEKSKNYLERLKVKSYLVSDPVYSLLQDRKIFENKEGILVQLRKFKGMSEELLKNLALCLKNNNIKEVKILSFQDSIDKEICIEFSEILKSYDIKSKVILEQNIENTIELINNAKFMISTRLHGAIVSNALKTKTFTLNYDEKLKTLSEELNLLNIDILNYSFEELNKKMSSFFNEASENGEYRRFDWRIFEDFLKK